MTKAGERAIEKAEHVGGGAGFILKEALLNKEELGEHSKMFSRVTVPAGCELGYHEHHGETETYYILSGSGVYNDNGKEVPAEAGDVFFCKDGDGHGLKNTGVYDLSFVALILYK
ncbi:cupin domain-containing protein [Faecalicatena contorta]|uniref:cupin domain-containing protein n=1 Tax=Faecalicatena contorta TaxID=39482 RepID=UPI001F186E6C|nr:cupin domain-containing protein [Faecalicatena contorta]MCF2680114.1 cupin domain-containing protein [Faecalicatena contorta]